MLPDTLPRIVRSNRARSLRSARKSSAGGIELSERTRSSELYRAQNRRAMIFMVSRHSEVRARKLFRFHNVNFSSRLG